jgi:hypothetical protein
MHCMLLGPVQAVVAVVAVVAVRGHTTGLSRW